MKISKKILTLFMVLLLTFSSISVSAAGKVTKKTVKDGHKLTITVKQDSLYTFKVLKGSQITIKKDGKYFEWIENDGYEHYVLLEKGKYTIEPDWLENATFTYSVDTAKSLDKGNYAPSKAASLKKNQLVKVAQTPMIHYNRWYKVKLTKNDYIKLKLNQGDQYDVTVYNSRMAKIDTEVDNNKIMKTSDKLVKGTYYIKVAENILYDYDASAIVFTLK